MVERQLRVITWQMFITQVIIIRNWCHMFAHIFLMSSNIGCQRWPCSKLDNQHSYFFSQATPVGSIVTTVLSNQLQNNWWVCLKYHGLLIWDQLKSLDAILPWYIYLSHFYRLCSHHRIVCPTFSSTGDLAKTCNDNKLTKLFLFRRGDTMVGVEKTVKWLQQHSHSIHPPTRILVHL